MNLDTFNGLPLHVLLVHAVVVGVPLAALFVVLHAVWPAARRRLGFVTPVVAGVALVFVPITTNAGEWLQDHINATGALEEKIKRHADLGETLLPLVIALFVVAVALWSLARRYDFGLIRDRAPKDEPRGDVAANGGRGSTATAVRTQPATRTVLPTWASA